MKKNIALVLALVMILSLIPMTAFATSSNSVNKTPVVGKNASLTDAGITLRIAEDDSSWPATGTEVFELHLGDGAKWDLTGATLPAAGIQQLAGDKILVVTLTDTALSAGAIEMPMAVQLDDAPSGEQKVEVVGLDSVVSSGTYTYAIVESGATVATATSFTLSGRDVASGGSIRIQETVLGTVTGTQEFRLRLPRDFSWGADIAANEANYISLTGFGASNPVTAVIGGSSDRDLTVTLSGLTKGASRGTITIIPLIKAAKDADPTDVLVSISSSDDISDASGLKIATFKDYGYSIEVSTDAPDDEFIAGRVHEDYSVEITIDEDVSNTLFPGRYVDVELPSWVKVTSGTAIAVSDDTGSYTVDPTSADDDTNSFEFMMPNRDVDGEIEITFDITVKANEVPEGSKEITATIVGAGLDDEVVIGTAIPAITVEVEEAAVLEIGGQEQMAPAIIITENFAGALRDTVDSEDGWVWFKTGGLFAGSARFDNVDVEVVEGDIELGDTKTSNAAASNPNDYFGFEIKAESEEASVIRVYDVEITLDRTVPMGPFDLDVQGNAIVDPDNAAHEDFVSRAFRIAPYFEVGTPVDGVMADPQITFTIGQSGYLVDGEMMLMDTAPFISEGRTMVPVKYLEELFGMAPIWNASSRTVTIMYENKVYEMAIGSTWLKVNGANFLEMETPAMIVDDRTFVPLSRFALAMGIDYTWDQATQTVVFN